MTEKRVLDDPPHLVPALLFVALIVAVVGSLGAPLITYVATEFHVSLVSSQWTLTIPLLTGAVATPLLGRLGAGPHRRAAVLVTLLIVAAGSILTALPLPFTWLIVGRGIQGVGLALPALMMGVARDHVSKDRAPSAIALISVASTVGVGIGYPLVGLITDLAGVRAAYYVGLMVVVAAFFVALYAIPSSPPGRSSSLDVSGAVMLAAGLFPILLVASETSLWTRHFDVSILMLVVSAAILFVWWKFERRSDAPLVDVTLLRHRAVAGANLTMLVGGMGMYLLLTLITRYSQTPGFVGYGFGLTAFTAGLVLVPFSAMGYVAGKTVPKIRGRVDSYALLSGSVTIGLVAFAIFGFGRSHMVVLLLGMATLGFAVGSFSASMPAVILAVTPRSETSSAMSFNMVVRSVGFSLGSAVGGLILAAGTATGNEFPRNSGYSAAAWVGAAAMVVAMAFTLIIGRDSSADRESVK